MNCETAKLTSKGQLTLPKSVRDKLNLDKGSYIAIYLEKDSIVMKKVNPRKALSEADPIWDMVGMFHEVHDKERNPRECTVTAIGERVKWKPLV